MVSKIRDKGVTWRPTIIGIDPHGKYSERHGKNFNETSLLYLGNGEVLAMVRCDETFIQPMNSCQLGVWVNCLYQEALIAE